MSQTGRFGNTSKRLPIVFCLDVSPSMNWDVDNSDIIPIELLNDSVNTFIREINSDGRTKSSAEVAYVTFSTNIEVDSQFMPARNLDNIHLKTVREGGTNMAQAVLRAYEKLEQRVAMYEQMGLRYNVPFFVLPFTPRRQRYHYSVHCRRRQPCGQKHPAALFGGLYQRLFSHQR